MPTYIVLANYTHQGVKNISESAERLDQARALAESVGASIQEFYLVMGQYDIVTVVEAPDDETLAKVVLTLGHYGNVSTETLKAFPEDAYRELISASPLPIP
jgi:uncharacterized protein with GYD domain